MNTSQASLVIVCAALLCATADAQNKDSGRKALLDERSYYRWSFTYRPEQMREEDGTIRERTRRELTFWKRKEKKADAPVFVTDWPEAGWAGADYDDSGWMRVRGPMVERTVNMLGGDVGVKSPCLRLMCARGKFAVSDPTAVKDMSLSLAYRGGVVVRVNGKEVGRGHMPEGNTGPDTPALDYPDSAYVSQEGPLLPFGTTPAQYHTFELRKKEIAQALKKMGLAESNVERCAQRIRTVENIRIPPDVLRKGVNVLAIEVHRAPTARVFYTAERKDKGGVKITWPMISLETVQLTAPNESAAESNTGRPEALQVWAETPLMGIQTPDYGDRFGKPASIDLVGARNGHFSGQLVVSSAEEIKDMEVRVSDLAPAGGQGVIPASSIRIGYALPDGLAHSSTHKHYEAKPDLRTRVPRFDALEGDAAHIPSKGRMTQPVWVTVCVPRDAAPGVYKGKVTVRANGSQTDLPLAIDVIDHVLPDPQSYVSFLDLIQSPRTLSIKYDAPMWSDRHWALIDRSFELLGELGASSIYVPAICNTHHGNGEYTMIQWVKRQDGTYDHDFSLFEKYLDTAVRHLGKVLVVCLYVYDPVKAYGQADKCIPLKVRVRDEQGGDLRDMDAPDWESEGSEAFWKPVFAGARERLARRGMADSLAVGTAGQGMPKPAIPVMNRVDPDARWVIFQHYLQKDVGGKPSKLTGSVITWPGDMNHAPLFRYYGWQDDPTIVTYFPRRFPMRLDEECLQATYQMVIETLLASGFKGIGWCGADFWPVIKGGPAGRVSNITLPNWLQLSLGEQGLAYILAPGQDGPVRTVRFEVMREGLQEAETRIFIEKALTDAAQKAKLGDKLAAECESFLDLRISAMSLAIGTSSSGNAFWKDSEEDVLWYIAGVQERKRRLFELAAQVARALGGEGGN